MSESENVRIFQNRKTSEYKKMSEFFKTGKCRNLKMSEFFKTGKCQNLKIYSFRTGKCQNPPEPENVMRKFLSFDITSICHFFKIRPNFEATHFWHFPVLKVSDIFQFWKILTFSDSDIFRFWRILTFSDSDVFRLWHFPDLTKNGFWRFQILTCSCFSINTRTYVSKIHLGDRSRPSAIYQWIGHHDQMKCMIEADRHSFWMQPASAE